MWDKRSRIYVRVALVIASLSAVLAVLSASFAYVYKLDQQTDVSRQLVQQLGKGVQRPAAISAYIEDDVLASEILNGLVINDLVAGASILNGKSLTESVGDTTSSDAIVLTLADPFDDTFTVGRLTIYPDQAFIKKNAQQTSTEYAISLLLTTLLIALTVGFVVERSLTTPLEKLTKAFDERADKSPELLTEIDIGYKKTDEISQLINGINSLTSTVKEQFSREQQLRQHFEKLQHHFKLIFEQASAGIGIIDSNGIIITKNPAFNQLCPPLAETNDFISVFEQSIHLNSHLERLRRMTTSEQVAVDLSFKDSSSTRVLHCLFARISGERNAARELSDVLIEVIAYDITERTDRERRIRFEADHDVLTGLYNRRAGKREIKMMIDANPYNTAIFMIDLDKFKPVNDVHGHDVGDVVLRDVANIIKQRFAQHTAVTARWGGDEFTIALATQNMDDIQIADLCKQLIHDISQPIHLNPELSVQIGASIGVVSSSEFGADIDFLLSVADQTMYQVKSRSRGDYLIAEK